MSLKDATPEKLVAAASAIGTTVSGGFTLSGSTRGTRQAGCGARTDPAWSGIKASTKSDSIAAPFHALWTMHGLQDALDNDANSAQPGRLIRRHRSHPSPGVRMWNAVQVLPKDAKSITAILEAGVLNDVDANVSLAAMLRHGRISRHPRPAPGPGDPGRPGQGQ